MVVEQSLPKSSFRPGVPAAPVRGESTPTPRAQARTRILVLDDRGVMRDGLCALLAGTDEFTVVGAESSGAAALESAANARAQLVVIDFSHTLQNGAELIAGFKTRLPDVRVLVLTFHKEYPIVTAALRAGADGYVLKNDSCSELFTALRSVAAGKSFISASLGERVTIEGLPTRDSGGTAGGSGELTDRERQVMRLIAAGRRTREIAGLLSLSHKTIEKHRTSLMRKLGLRNASAVAAYAIAHGLGES